MIVRVLSCVPVLVCLAAAPAQAAPAAQKPAEKAGAPAKEPEPSEAEYRARRERDEARQRLWDRKMKDLTGSVCTGC